MLKAKDCSQHKITRPQYAFHVGGACVHLCMYSVCVHACLSVCVYVCMSLCVSV